MTEESSKKFEDRYVALLEEDEKKIQLKMQKIREMGQNIKEVIGKDLSKISKTVEEIKTEANAWLITLQKYYGDDWKQRRMSEISAFEGNRGKISDLSKDLTLVLEGLKTDNRYASPFADLKKITEELKELTGYINSFFKSKYLVYLLEKISSFGISGVNFELDEGSVYVLSSEFRGFLEKTTKTDLASLLNTEKIESSNKVIQKLSCYANDPEHMKHLRKLSRSLLEAKKTLASRKKQNLIWCENYENTCAIICPGFTLYEPYCKTSKSSPYNSGRLDLILRLMGDAYTTVQKAISIESQLSAIKR